MNWAEKLIAAGFRRFDLLQDLESDLCVTQIGNEGSRPVRGYHLRGDGSFPWSVRVAPSREVLDATVPLDGPVPAG